jgi:hypothetical protein
MKIQNLKLIGLFLLSALCVSVAKADLAVSATPGFVFSDTPSGRPTVANLNRALNMTYAITGSIGGTNAGLSAGSVSGTMLMDSVVDNVTVQFVGSPRGIEVMDGGINIDQLNVAVAGLGLGGGGGAALSNKTDNVTITITNDVLTLCSNLPVRYLAWTTNTLLGASTYGTNMGLAVSSAFDIQTNTVTLRQFTSAEVEIAAAGTLLSTNHGMGFLPTWVRAVLVCKTNDLSWTAGDEVGVEGVYNFGTPFTIKVNATSLVAYGNAGFNSHSMIPSDGNGVNITSVRWRLKVYMRP